MPNRYYQADPGLTGMLQFLAGLGQANRETAIANAQLRGQQNQLIGSGIGQGIGNMFSVPANMFLEDMQARRQTQQRGQLQQQEYDLSRRNQLALERTRNQGDIYQAGIADYYKRYGEMPPIGGADIGTQFGPGAMRAPTIQPPQVPPGEYGMSLPDQGISQTFPQPPSPPPVDISQTSGYIKKVKERDALRLSKLEIEQRLPDGQQKVYELSAVAQRLGPIEQFLRANPAPKPPANEQEMIAAGANNGGVTPFADGRVLVPKGMTLTMPEKGLRGRKVTVSWADGSVDERPSGHHARVIPGYGLETVDIDENGNTTSKITSPSAKDGGSADYLKVRAQALKEAPASFTVSSDPKKRAELDAWLDKRTDELMGKMGARSAKGQEGLGPLDRLSGPDRAPVDLEFSAELVDGMRSGRDVRAKVSDFVGKMSELWSDPAKGQMPPELAQRLIEMRFYLDTGRMMPEEIPRQKPPNIIGSTHPPFQGGGIGP